MSNYFMEHKFPEELKTMTPDELELLTYEIRDFLVDKVSKTGGHLASNLGTVELTVALFKTFDMPDDKLIWDVGHQTYVHKLLTGRYAGFDSLRQLDGMSGFPKQKESVYDLFDTGHSSTSISLAQGMAVARDLKGESYNVIAVIGDGAMTGGMAYEALNNMVNIKGKMIVILNDNGMSISPNNGGMSSYLGKMRNSRKYVNLKHNVKRRLGNIPGIGDGIVSGVQRAKESIKYAVIDEGMFFEEMGIKYFGPVDGHNVEELCETLELAKESDRPVLIHAYTKKGKGYSIAEENPDIFHGIGPFDPNTGDLVSKYKDISYSKVFGNKLMELAARDKSIVAISAAMIDGTGLKEFSKKYKNRTFDVGIAEEQAVTFAAGMARAGLRPFVTVYSTFLQRAYDQIIEDVCLQGLPVTLCLDRAGIVGADGETHHGIFDLSYLSSIPNLVVMAPKDKHELEEMMTLALKQKRPCAIRYPRGVAPDINDTFVKFGKAEELRNGDKCAIWAIGSMVKTALEAANILAEVGIEVSIYNARFLKPFDIDSLVHCVKEHNLIYTLEDNVLSGGLGETINTALINTNAEVINLCWPDKFIEHGTSSQLYKRYGLDAETIAERIKEKLER